MACDTNKKEILTKESVEQIFMRAFGLDEFPGWESPARGHLMVRGKNSGSEEMVIFSYWPNTGNYLFQGKDSEKRNNTAKWESACKSYLSAG